MNEFQFKSQSFETSIESLKKELIENGFKVVAEVPTSSILAKAGFSIIPVHQVFFFRPDFLNELLSYEKEVLMLAPMKIVITEEEGKIIGRYYTADSVFKKYSGLNSFVSIFDELLNKIVKSL